MELAFSLFFANYVMIAGYYMRHRRGVPWWINKHLCDVHLFIPLNGVNLVRFDSINIGRLVI